MDGVKESEQLYTSYRGEEQDNKISMLHCKVNDVDGSTILLDGCTDCRVEQWKQNN